MTDKDKLIEELTRLCHPLSEGMSDGARLTAFVHAGNKAIELLTVPQQHITYSSPEKEALLGLAYHKIDNTVSGFNSEHAGTILAMLKRFTIIEDDAIEKYAEDYYRALLLTMD